MKYPNSYVKWFLVIVITLITPSLAHAQVERLAPYKSIRIKVPDNIDGSVVGGFVRPAELTAFLTKELTKAGFKIDPNAKLTLRYGLTTLVTDQRNLDFVAALKLDIYLYDKAKDTKVMLWESGTGLYFASAVEGMQKDERNPAYELVRLTFADLFKPGWR